jgi:hypothetical protein
MKNIYTLEDPRTGHIRYVGATHNLKERNFRHNSLSNKANIKKHFWIKELKENKLRAVMNVIDFGGRDIENYWIEQMRAWGFDLLNEPEKVTFKKISDSNKGVSKDEKHKEKLKMSNKMYNYIVFKNDSIVCELDSLGDIVKKIGISLTHVSRLSINGGYTKDGISIKRLPK